MGEVENIFKNREGTKQISNARVLKIWGNFTQQHTIYYKIKPHAKLKPHAKIKPPGLGPMKQQSLMLK
jgi:hypothetical protein